MKIERWKLVLGVVVTLSLLALSVPWGGDLGWAYLANRQYALAERMFTQTLRGDPGDADLWLGLAATYAALGDPGRQIATLEDLGSKNGTFVRGVRVEGSQSLSDGDILMVGRVPMVFRIFSESGSTESVKSGTR